MSFLAYSVLNPNFSAGLRGMLSNNSIDPTAPNQEERLALIIGKACEGDHEAFEKLMSMHGWEAFPCDNGVTTRSRNPDTSQQITASKFL